MAADPEGAALSEVSGVAPTNRLSRERSPYLRQHAHNPVDWYPWADEAFARARQEDKPIFLSIGYATCHWCHVMERESFEDPDIARLLNDSFVSIKVDREEHPDVDQIYMQAVMQLNGHGGWPLTLFLTPARQPFFGGTYFPPQRRGPLIGMQELLPNIAEAWRARRAELTRSAQELTAAIQQALGAGREAGAATETLLRSAYEQAAGAFDAAHGGFGEAPKFPRPVELCFLLRYAHRAQQPQARAMVLTTLEHMARGGLHDHLGGGFHRYATDAQWLVPHFEKMLYDQALLARAYLEAYRITRQSSWGAIARGIFRYVLRDLMSPEGGFYTAEDADSEGIEGKFYVWTPQEIRDVLGATAAERFCAAYGVTTAGNFEQGASILHGPLPEEAAEGQAACAHLLARRNARVRPLRDQKILTSWNGLMIGALAYGGATFGDAAYTAAASRAAAMVLERLRDASGLLRRYCEGEAKYAGGLEDYAFFTQGLLELYQAGGDPRWLAEALTLARQMNERFWDAAHGGWFTRDARQPALIVQAKDGYDGATPSGNAMALQVNLWLARLTGEASWAALVPPALEQAAAAVAQAPLGFPQYLSVLDHWLGPSQEITLAGEGESPALQALARVVHERWLPRTVVAWRQAPGQAAAFLCRGSACQPPVSDPHQLAHLLEVP
jgi:uncharacterized protein YyaL (SSP411 family)